MHRFALFIKRGETLLKPVSYHRVTTYTPVIQLGTNTEDILSWRLFNVVTSTQFRSQCIQTQKCAIAHVKNLQHTVHPILVRSRTSECKRGEKYSISFFCERNFFHQGIFCSIITTEMFTRK